QTIPSIFNHRKDLPSALNEVLKLLENLPRHWESEPARVEMRRSLAPKLLMEFADLIERDSESAGVLHSEIAEINGTPGDPASFDRLHNLLEAQAYRFALWRVSAEEINYRRFFDINDLIGLRMENPTVFAATHGLMRRLLAENLVAGLRIDHP